MDVRTPGSSPASEEDRATARAARTGGGPRQRKHVPLRTCIACRRTLPKRELIRIVHTPEETIEIDLKGKRAGRGAYLCHQQECWDAALKQGVLGRALKTLISSKQTSDLRIQLEGTMGQDRDPSQRSG